ncbi:MAG: hypothetical protein R6V10_15205 [bacterium]
MEINCTQCGAGVPIEEDSEFVRCPYCETALYVDTDRTLKHYYFVPQVAEKDLPYNLGRKLAYMEIDEKVNITSVRLVYFPFWRLHLATGGILAVPAAPPPVEDLFEYKFPAGDLKLFNHDILSEHETVDKELALEDAVMEARKDLDPDKARFSDAALVHIPIYDVSYTCRNSKNRAVVDAVSGNTFADEWPPAPQKHKDRVLGWITALSLGLFTIEAALIPGVLFLAPAYALTGAGLYYYTKRTLTKMGW